MLFSTKRLLPNGKISQWPLLHGPFLLFRAEMVYNRCGRQTGVLLVILSSFKDHLSCMKRLSAFLFFLFSSLLSHAQGPPFSCDSLVGKPYSVLYEEADAILLGQIVEVSNRSYATEYSLTSLYNYKGGWNKVIFVQYNGPQWVPFEEYELLVLLIFQDYQDEVFSPCILFGKKEKMGGLLHYAESRCGEEGPDPDRNCLKNMQPVCGCNGKTYGNPCMAEKEGIYTYDWGDCRTRFK